MVHVFFCLIVLPTALWQGWSASLSALLPSAGLAFQDVVKQVGGRAIDVDATAWCECFTRSLYSNVSDLQTESPEWRGLALLGGACHFPCLMSAAFFLLALMYLLYSIVLRCMHA